MREKRRYILVESTLEFIGDSRKEFEAELSKRLLHSIGEISYFRANPRIVRFVSGKRFIMRCSLAKYKETVTALTFIKNVSGRDAGLYTIGASGTISALMKSNPN